VERDLQVVRVRRWRELVIDRDKWRGTVRQAKAKKKKKKKKKKEEEEEEEEVKKKKKICNLPLAADCSNSVTHTRYCRYCLRS
jgi:hypothetical protein